jgi:hypothetical protein
MSQQNRRDPTAFARNHFGLGQPMFIEYVWGRQIGEYTINP